MLLESDILAALRDCFDPEVKLNVVDLGLIYEIELRPDPDSTPRWPRQCLQVRMTLTTADSPYRERILEQVRNRLATIPDLSKVELELAWEPRWTPQRISPTGRRQLGI